MRGPAKHWQLSKAFMDDRLVAYLPSSFGKTMWGYSCLMTAYGLDAPRFAATARNSFSVGIGSEPVASLSVDSANLSSLCRYSTLNLLLTKSPVGTAVPYAVPEIE